MEKNKNGIVNVDRKSPIWDVLQLKRNITEKVYEKVINDDSTYIESNNEEYKIESLLRRYNKKVIENTWIDNRQKEHFYNDLKEQLDNPFKDSFHTQLGKTSKWGL